MQALQAVKIQFKICKRLYHVEKKEHKIIILKTQKWNRNS